MATQPKARRRLAALMDERRTKLRLTWQEVAERGGVSLRALANARTGDSEIRPLTQAGIEAGLSWGQGSVERVLAGDDPVLLAAVVSAPRAAPPARAPVDFTDGNRDALQPFIEPVLRAGYEILDVMDRFGDAVPDPVGNPEFEVALSAVPSALLPLTPHEGTIWDDRRLLMREKLDVIGRLRQLNALMDAEEKRRTGLSHPWLTGGIPASGGIPEQLARASSCIPPPISVGRTAARASH